MGGEMRGLGKLSKEHWIGLLVQVYDLFSCGSFSSLLVLMKSWGKVKARIRAVVHMILGFRGTQRGMNVTWVVELKES